MFLGPSLFRMLTLKKNETDKVLIRTIDQKVDCQTLSCDILIKYY